MLKRVLQYTADTVLSTPQVSVCMLKCVCGVCLCVCVCVLMLSPTISPLPSPPPAAPHWDAGRLSLIPGELIRICSRVLLLTLDFCFTSFLDAVGILNHFQTDCEGLERPEMLLLLHESLWTHKEFIIRVSKRASLLISWGDCSAVQ